MYDIIFQKIKEGYTCTNSRIFRILELEHSLYKVGLIYNANKILSFFSWLVKHLKYSPPWIFIQTYRNNKSDSFNMNSRALICCAFNVKFPVHF